MANLMYLPDWTVTDFEIDSDGAYRIPASYNVAPEHCVKCGAVGNLYKHGAKITAYVDAPVHGRQTFIEVRRARYRCRDCGGTFMQDLPDMDDSRRMTVRCRDYIAQQALLKPNTHVANDVGVDEKIVRQIGKENAALDGWRTSLPSHLRPLFGPVLTATKNWEAEILNYFDHGRYTNAATEARNRVIKMTNRLGAGYSFPAIRARTLFGKRPGRVKKEKAAAEAARKAAMVQCDICKALFEPAILEINHIRPISHGGSIDANNRQKVCPNCHRLHTEDWLKPVHGSTPLSE